MSSVHHSLGQALVPFLHFHLLPEEPAQQERQGTAAVGKNPADVGIARGSAAEQQTGDGTGSVGAPFDGAHADLILEIAAAGRRVGMRVDHRLAAIKLLPDGGERRVPQPAVSVVGHHADAIGLERVERVRDLAQAAFDVGQRQGGEQGRGGRGNSGSFSRRNR